MSANAISIPGRTPGGQRRRLLALRMVLLAFGLALARTSPAGPAGLVSPPAIAEAARVERIYLAARQEHSAAQTNVLLAWQFGRACFDRAEFATNHAERALLADQGIAACRNALVLQPVSAGAHYYLAMNLGQLARTKSLGALKLVNQMETEFKTARQLDGQFDFAGPDRNLGLLYLEAPGWPTSIGSRTKARQHLRRAVELAPQHPENRLCLLEALLRWGDHKGAQRELQETETIRPVAITNLVGEAWEATWVDWRARRCIRRSRRAAA